MRAEANPQPSIEGVSGPADTMRTRFLLKGVGVTRSSTIDAEQQLDTTSQIDDVADTGFGAEFRELARQRRFVREAAGMTPEAAEPVDWRSQPAPTAAAPTPVVPTPTPATPPTPAPRRERVRMTGVPRMTEDASAMIAELARMSDRLVEAREGLTIERLRADRAETELRAVNDRLMAARVLVHDAQHATRMTAERCAWLEGRAETLQEALDLAVNASLFTRWRWRRRMLANR